MTKPSASPTFSPRSIGICFSCGVRTQQGKDVMAWDTKARVDKAFMLYQMGIIDAILCTGGIFQKGQKRPISVVMAEYLRLKGVPEEAIVTEEQSVDTIENVSFGLALLKKKGFFRDIKTTEDVRLVLISERLHLRRIELSMHAFLEKLNLDHLVPLLMEPVWYSVSALTTHSEEAAFQLALIDPLGEQTKEARKLAAK